MNISGSPLHHNTIDKPGLRVRYFPHQAEIVVGFDEAFGTGVVFGIPEKIHMRGEPVWELGVPQLTHAANATAAPDGLVPSELNIRG